jgi:hypothetical protein
MTDLAESLNHHLQGFTDVISLALTYDESYGYDMRIILENSKNERVKLLCRDVSSVHIEKFGGGLSQLMGLYAYDVRSQQLDRIKLKFLDRANERTSFDCSAAEVTQMLDQ